MGQYFIAVNVTKKEYIRCWEIGGRPRLYEWCSTPQAGIFPYLLRKNDNPEGCNGDVEDPNPKYAGRWAGDEIYLVSDCDSSALYIRAQKSFKDIAKDLVKEYNRFIKIDYLRLGCWPIDKPVSWF